MKSSRRNCRKARTTAGSSAALHYDDPKPIIRSAGAQDSRHHTRVWKACERCKMKKTKCDGELPCNRCRDYGLICTAARRKRVETKKIPGGYAEVLESTQLTLIATIRKLYLMVRDGQGWELGEPHLDARGRPVVHSIAEKLGCIRPNADIDLPVSSVFPEDEAGMDELVVLLEKQQQTGYAEDRAAPGAEVGYGDADKLLEVESDSFAGSAQRATSRSEDNHDYGVSERYESDHDQLICGRDCNGDCNSGGATAPLHYCAGLHPNSLQVDDCAVGVDQESILASISAPPSSSHHHAIGDCSLVLNTIHMNGAMDSAVQYRFFQQAGISGMDDPCPEPRLLANDDDFVFQEPDAGLLALVSSDADMAMGTPRGADWRWRL